MKERTARLAVLAVIVLAIAPAAAYAAIPSVPSTHFQRAEGCGCHAAFVDQWSRTMHSKALSDPLYQAKLADANHATKGALGAFCESCHGPVAAMSGMVGANGKPRDAVADQGINCDFCHQLTGTSQPPANMSWIIKPDAVKRAQFKDAQSPSHATAYSAYHESAEFCGACHNVNHPVNGMPLEATYTEWKNGPYAAKGVTCQDCHMTPGAGVTKPNPGKAAAFGPDRPHIYTMTFAGGNVGLGDPVLAEQRLKAAATVEMESPRILEPGKTGAIKVTVTNVGAGHYLPTGLTELRECWLQVTVTNADGSTVIDDRKDFHTVLKDKNGNGPVELWDATGVLEDTRIPPQESRTFDYSFAMPDGADSVEVTAALYYRSAPEELAKDAGVEIPTTLMAAQAANVFASEDAAGRVERAIGPTGSGEDRMAGIILVIGLAALAMVVGVFVVGGLRNRLKGAMAGAGKAAVVVEAAPGEEAETDEAPEDGPTE